MVADWIEDRNKTIKPLSSTLAMTAMRQAIVPKSEPPQRVFAGMGKYTVTEAFHIAGKCLNFLRESPKKIN